MTGPDADGPDGARPYAGLRVLDVSQGLAGPYCTGLLALHGAEVIKVEPPEGDWARGIGKAFGEQTPLALQSNRGKRGITLDLKRPGAREALLELAAASDVFVESFRPGVADRLGIGWEDVRAVRPDVIYLSVSGFGQTGPWAGRAGTDMVLQAFSGLMSINHGMDGIPHRLGMVAVDTATALYACQALQAALYARREGAGGRRIDVSLMQSAAAFLSHKIAAHQLEDGAPSAFNAPAGSYRTSDGWIAVTLVKEAQYVRLCEAIGRPDLAEDPRFADFRLRSDHIDALVPEVAAAIAGRATAEWIEIFGGHDVLCSPILDFGQWLENDHVRSCGALVEVDQPGAGPVILPLVPGVTDQGDLTAPGNGEHGCDILAGFGMDEERIHALREAGALIVPDGASGMNGTEGAEVAKAGVDAGAERTSAKHASAE